MHEFATLRADAVTERPAPHLVCLFQAALWGPACDLKTALRRMRPAFTVGGFPLPPFRRHRMLAIDAGTALPPAGGYVEDAARGLRIDGGSASRPVLPARRGDPCVEHLHIVPGTAGIWRRRAGERIGLVVRGRGRAHHEAGPPLALYPGRALRIPPGELHRFETAGEALDIVVFQPAGDRDEAEEALLVPEAASPGHIPINERAEG